MKTRTVASRIKKLEIQGARNVARMGLQALAADANGSKMKTLGAFQKEVKANAKLLAVARPTEPALRNGLAVVLRAMKREDSLEKSKKAVMEAVLQYTKGMETAKEKIINIGVKRIKKGMTIMTHCHSSTVTSILVKAWKKGIKFKVINTETRPRYQGRMTAKELAKVGIPVTHIVDSAARRDERG
jgi:ribose 1,5-bisphosphate isomerase